MLEGGLVGVGVGLLVGGYGVLLHFLHHSYVYVSERKEVAMWPGTMLFVIVLARPLVRKCARSQPAVWSNQLM